jgi:rhodanese-related sulfurtransferase
VSEDDEVDMNLLAKLFGSSSVSSIDPAQVQERLSPPAGQGKGRSFLLDVRQPDEYRAGHIAGATLIPLGELPQRMGDLPKDREIICVCRSGHRSQVAVRQLQSAGFNVVNLKGGMINWSMQRLPVKKGSGK